MSAPGGRLSAQGERPLPAVANWGVEARHRRTPAGPFCAIHQAEDPGWCPENGPDSVRFLLGRPQTCLFCVKCRVFRGAWVGNLGSWIHTNKTSAFVQTN